MRQQAQRMFRMGPKSSIPPSISGSTLPTVAAAKVAETSSSTVVATSKPNTLTILALGDSLTEG